MQCVTNALIKLWFSSKGACLWALLMWFQLAHTSAESGLESQATYTTPRIINANGHWDKETFDIVHWTKYARTHTRTHPGDAYGRKAINHHFHVIPCAGTARLHGMQLLSNGVNTNTPAWLMQRDVFSWDLQHLSSKWSVCRNCQVWCWPNLRSALQSCGPFWVEVQWFCSEWP